MARPVNRKVPMKDLPEFDDWFHVISDPIVVKVYAGSDEHQRGTFKDELVNILRQDDMPTIMRTVRIRLSQLQDLMECWGGLIDDMLNSRIVGIKVEVIVHTEMVIDGRRLCSELDLFQIGGLESALGGPFSTISCALDKFLYWCRFYISTFAVEVHGRNENA
ncbi:unnamed protein product [Sphagnum jensenii]|uniref:Uncharacterized protein n=1 Tax=Sphagnum jensenii TaxID=128206 RepID=A0ABP0XIQ3_9BRYO